ncbi:MAG: hypothetical protein ABIZ70_01570, partial [Gemmatimonadales bacterium]
KPISLSAVPLALDKAERYRLLNQPWAAESICLDILSAEPGNQKALQVLLLARTDQFGSESAGAAGRARETLSQFTSDYDRAYYGGIICERRARAQLDKRTPGAGQNAHEWLMEAMALYERAEAIRPAGDDDAILRWNSCARLLNDSPHIAPREREMIEPAIGE